MRQISALEIGYQHAQIDARIHDMPIGNAFKGPAYGEYNKDSAIGMILGVVASVFTMGAAMPMLASVGSLATQIAGGVMMAGGVLTGVGAITGNKKLMKVGGILSLAGGIGGWAANATGITLGTGSEALAKFALETTGSIDAVLGTSLQQTAATAAAGSIDAGLAYNTAAGLADPIIQQAGTQAGTQAVAQTAEQAAAAHMQQAITPKSGLLQTELAGQGGQTGTIPLAGAQPPAAGATTAPAGSGTAATTTAPPPPPPPKTSILKSALNFTKENPELVKIAGGAITEFAKAGFAPDQEAMMAADARYKDAAAAKLGQETVLLAWQDANRKKQVALISENDPARDAKVAAATAAGHAVAIIPVVGRPQTAPGTTPTTNAQTITANNPAPVFNATVPATR